MIGFLPSLLGGVALALPPDEVDAPEALSAYEDAPVDLPATGPDAPCGEDDQLGVEVDVVVSRAGSFLTFPSTAGVASWRLQATLYFGPHRIRWTQEVSASSSTQLSLPAEALVDGYQAQWLSRIQLKAYALDAGGHLRGEQRLPSVYVVWEAGTSLPPLWLDEEAQRLQAPAGAWADRALYTVSTGELLEIEPPTGGAL